MPKIIKETELPECGLMQIEGECYQDVLAILSRNGYTTEMTTEPCDIPCEAKHIIRYWKVVKQMQEEIEQIVVETYKKAVKDFANFLIDKDYIDGFLMPDIVVKFFNNIEKG